MPKFDSPLGTKQFQGQPMREINVPDDGNDFDQQPMPRHRRGQAYEQGPPGFDESAMQDFQGRSSNPNIPRELSGLESNILAAKKAKRDGRERLSDGAKRRIEMLVGMARMTKTFDVEGTTFTLQTLRSKEVRDGLAAAVPFDGTIHFSFESAKQTLARSLIEIAGASIDQFLSSSDLDVRLDFIEDLPQALFTRLYNEYAALDNEAQAKFAMKSEAEVKEVVEDLKK